MATAVEAPQQYKQPSRKGKRAWRKNVDVSEIQEGLETVREEVINGGIVAEKPSEALFTLDTTGSTAIQKAYNKIHKPLKSDQILAQRSAVPAVDSRKRSGVTDGVVEPSSKRRKANGLSHREYERLKNIAYGGETVHKDVIKADGTPAHDPWEDVVEQPDPRFSYLEKSKKVRAPRTLNEAPISLAAGAKRIPAVKRPNAGISYNPSFQDWDQLLTEEGAKEVEAEKKRLKEAEEERVRLERIAAAQDERDDIQTEDESAWEGFESEYEGEEWLTKRRPERKTPAERNKVKRRKEAERQAKWDAQMKKRAHQALQIKSIARQVEARERAKAEAKVQAGESSSDGIDDRVLRRRKLGNASLPEPHLELVLPDELQDSLRLLKPEGNLLKDRFRSILVRGKVETRKPIQQAKKARRTYTEKWTYKDFKIPTS
ncbi:MAG: hypothetical protein FRX48_06834 [Lasallia pustulata]|uniref:Ribosome biogenesis protein NOP53 n=1 Tax=Lasallia pustulata TaxID=136370 RepID=A0A5M8PIP1_9LECA|nr:MAG: hypothetical protein FRX48_06834 [Lasallia pustulata]